ncbi:response regulator [Parachitinimonas caeni]|uniref:Response regulator n=1 Tax=Parachitinimonas caeni TaxID=3031301 RepID=A0ABT7DWP9_9NEIS|nr:response regulator [Parachitinimonas caeni]MDK2124451.1 response regulator [Parachitinimonas caeni]
MIDQIEFSELKVLVVDDQRFVRDIVGQLLGAMTINRVFQANSVDAAVEVMRKQALDMVICDINMKPVNGLHLLKAVRMGLTDLSRDTNFLFLSGHSDRAVVERAMALDVDGFIVKPVKPIELEKRVRAALARQQVVRPKDQYSGVSVNYRETVNGLVFDDYNPPMGGIRW